MKLNDLTIHPENNKIYSPSDLTELENSLSSFGQLEPLAITKDKKIISGHRRFNAMQNLGWEECDIRFVTPENELIALVESNRHRVKTNQDVINEARIIKRELEKSIGKGRYARTKSKEKRDGKSIRVADEVAKRLGFSPTRYKQLLSISNYEPDLVAKIDAKEITVTKAYEYVRTHYITPKNQEKESPKDEFKEKFISILKDIKPPLTKVNSILKETYPYCLEMTNIDEDRRKLLIEDLERLKKMDTRQEMMTRKRDELDFLDTEDKDLTSARNLLPDYEELERFFSVRPTIEKFQIIPASNQSNQFTPHLWNILRVCISNAENNNGPGRGISYFAGFENENGFRLLGIFQFRSDVHTLDARDRHIGWSNTERVRYRENIVNLATCVPTQPFGSSFLGGKFISFLSKEGLKIWEEKYQTKIFAMTTTSLFGFPSQYDGNPFWKRIGKSRGTMLTKPSRQEWLFWRNWYKENFPDKYEESSIKTSPTQSNLFQILKILEISNKDLKTEEERGIYFRSLIANSRDALRGRTPMGSSKSSHQWLDWWYEKSTNYNQEKMESDKIDPEQLFHSYINPRELALYNSS